MPSGKWAIGIDINVSKITVAAVNENGKILNQKSLMTPSKDGPKVVINGISNVVKEIIQSVNLETPPVGVGVGMAGQIDPIDGVVYFAPNLNWREVPLQSELKDYLHLPVSVINDVRAVTLAEWRFGAGKGCNDLVCLYFSTGIGGCLITEGRLLKGSNNCAGEIGHMTVDVDGPPCTCGNWGCMEAFAGEWGILRNVKKAIDEEQDTKSLIEALSQERGESISIQLIMEAYRKNDLLATAIINQAVKAVIAGSASVVNALNPERLIIGGSLIGAFPELIDFVKHGIEERSLLAASQKLQVFRSVLRQDSGIIGAATYAISQA